MIGCGGRASTLGSTSTRGKLWDFTQWDPDSIRRKQKKEIKFPIFLEGQCKGVILFSPDPRYICNRHLLDQRVVCSAACQ